MPSNSTSLLFASGYARADQPEIQAYLFDETGGALTLQASFTGILNPSFLAVHPNQRWLYAVSETGKESDGKYGEVWSFQFEREPFKMVPLNQQTTNGDWPCHLRIDATGSWLVASNYGTGNAAIYPIQDDGSLGAMTDFVQHQGSGPNTARQEAAHAHSSLFTPDNRLLLIADLGTDQLAVYKLDPLTGKLSPHGSVKCRPGAGPRHLLFHPNGKWLYAANELDSTVTRYEYNAAQGTFLEEDSLSTIPAGALENTVADIHMNRAGTRLYVSNRGHNSIAVYDLADDGSMKLVSIPSCGGNWPRNFAIAPGGKFILVANQYSNEVCVLPVLVGADALGEAVARVTVTGASCVQFV